MFIVNTNALNRPVYKNTYAHSFCTPESLRSFDNYCNKSIKQSINAYRRLAQIYRNSKTYQR